MFDEIKIKISKETWDINCHATGLVEIGDGKNLLQLTNEEFNSIVSRRAELMVMARRIKENE